jgi:hypothetical protein
VLKSEKQRRLRSTRERIGDTQEKQDVSLVVGVSEQPGSAAKFTQIIGNHATF